MQRISKLTGTAAIVGLGLSLGAVAPAQAAPAVGPCNNVSVTVNPVEGSPGAGGYTEAITITNMGDLDCKLTGHPDVQRATIHDGGVSLAGAPADKTAEVGDEVHLEPGQSAIAELRVTRPELFDPADCGVVVGTHLINMKLPGVAHERQVYDESTACTSPALATMTVGVFK